MQGTVARYLAARQVTDRPATLEHFQVGLRRFIQWLARSAPDLESFADVTREQVLAYAAFLETETSPRTGKPLMTWTRRNYLAAVKLFFQLNEAAHAIQEVQAIRQRERDRGFRDTQTSVLTRYLFVRRGRRLSCDSLFSDALRGGVSSRWSDDIKSV